MGGDGRIQENEESRPEVSEDLLQRILAEGFSTGEEDHPNDYKDPARFDNPYEHTSLAIEHLQQFGLDFALAEYEKSIKAADGLDRFGEQINDDRRGNIAHLIELEREIKQRLSDEENNTTVEKLKEQWQEALIKENQLHLLYLSPAMCRLELAVALLRTGNQQYSANAEELIRQAFDKRPELTYSRELQEALANAREIGRSGQDGQYDSRKQQLENKEADNKDIEEVDSIDIPSGQRQRWRYIPGTGQVDREDPNRSPLSGAARNNNEAGLKEEIDSADRLAQDVIRQIEAAQRVRQKNLGEEAEYENPEPLDLPLPEEPSTIERLAKNPLGWMLVTWAGWKLYKRGRQWYARRVERNSEQTTDSSRVETGNPEHNIEPARVRRGRQREWGRTVDRTRMIDGAEVKVTTPLSLSNKRLYTVDGESYSLLRYPDRWFYKEGNGSSRSHVKLHVTTVGMHDLARLQRLLIPHLDRAVNRGDVVSFKTFDPNFIDSNWLRHRDNTSAPPGPRGQSTKGFTIYVTPEKAVEMAAELDKLLIDANLTLEGHENTGNSGDISRSQTASNRLSIERCSWRLTETCDRVPGALLDSTLSQRIHEEYRKYGVTEQGLLSRDALLKIESDCGIRRGQLTYDKRGRLTFLCADPESGTHSHRRYYVTERTAVRTPGEMTGRPAIYSLYQRYNLDPALEHINSRVGGDAILLSPGTANNARNETAVPRVFSQAAEKAPELNNGITVLTTELDPVTGKLRVSRRSGSGEVREVDRITPELLGEIIEERIGELKAELAKSEHDASKRAEIREAIEQLKPAQERLAAGDRVVMQKLMERIGIAEREGGGFCRAGRSWRGSLKAGPGLVFSLALLYIAARECSEELMAPSRQR